MKLSPNNATKACNLIEAAEISVHARNAKPFGTKTFYERNHVAVHQNTG